ncbi:MAG TPA: CHAT domain-containing protein [Vicinamibacterales bacterium]|nr:CHAT domain-containing protein [Vicinamibacterales bacterium]
MRALLPLVVFVLMPISGAARMHAQESTAARTLLAQVDALRKEKKEAEALETADRAMALAAEMTDRVTEVDAAVKAGRILYSMGRYADSQQRYERARATVAALNDRGREAGVLHGLGNAAWGLGRRAEARTFYGEAIALYRAAGMTREALRSTHGLLLLLDDPEEHQRLTAAAISEAIATKDVDAEGLLRQVAGDEALNRGRYADAYQQFQRAREIAESLGDRRQLALVQTSAGRLYRAHGEFDRAIELYQAALATQEEIGDTYGRVQSLNAIGSTLARQARLTEALGYYNRATELAAPLKSPRIDRFLLGARAGVLSSMGQHAQALPLLFGAIEGEESSYIRALRRRSIASTYLHLGDAAAALDQVEKEITATREARYLDELPRALILRAQIHETLGDIDGALSDAREAAALIEDMRRDLVPSDYMKRGFAEWNQLVYGVNVAIAARRGDTNAAFMAAEQGRARAFLDLLAVRNELRKARTAVSAAPAAPGAPSARPAALPARDRADSPMAAVTPSMERLAATAARLRSTILSYWVGDTATFLWVMTPDGQVRVRRINVDRSELERLVAQTLPDAVMPEPRPAASTIATRGPALELPAAPLAALRRLHTLLIEPAADILPASGRVTVVPHGPLFRLSFAALTDKRGKYFIERFAVHYVPSLAVLEFTAQASSRQRRSGYLIVADPSPMPSVMDAIDGRPRPLSKLPGSLREARAIAALLPPQETTLLEGGRAGEAEVAAALRGKRVLHLATHGIIRDSEPLASFIAVGESGRDAAHDGRLTAEELYDVDIDSDLVVLSACRSADGEVSGDGVFGLTRALLSGGAPSVIASAWAAADEPTAELMPDFYKAWLRTGATVESLRQAQLSLIRKLRTGRVQAHTPLGRITLREHPLFWAGFMLIGEPQ